MGRLKVLYDMIAALSEATEYQRPDHLIPIRLQAVLRRTGKDTLAVWFDKLNPATVGIGWEFKDGCAIGVICGGKEGDEKME